MAAATHDYGILSEEATEFYGDRVNGKRHGKGKLLWKNGSVYEGICLNNINQANFKTIKFAGLVN